MPNTTPVIPEFITVHLGAPDSDAPNVTVPFVDYIKNVASSEIFPTWPENAIRANVYAQISFALNRIYTDYYRSRGYDFDITNSIGIDQSFVNGRDIFENISQIVDEIFNDYIIMSGSIEPFFAAYCDGRELRCQGLEQWGTVSLAEQGYTPFEILQFYYGDNIQLVRNAPVGGRTQTWDGRTLGIGDLGNAVQQVQLRLNRISKNFPSIPKIYPVDGVFGEETENAVREYQRAFDLNPDGLVGKETWYSIQRTFNAVKRLNDLTSEGIRQEEIELLFNSFLEEGDTGAEVYELQYLLNLASEFNNEIPPVSIDGIFGSGTKNALEAFQRANGLEITGQVGLQDWDRLYREYVGIINSLPQGYFSSITLPYPGTVLRIGSSGEAVSALQEYLNYISNTYTSIPKTAVDGVFGPATQRAVLAYKEIFGLGNQGIVSSSTWDSITSTYRDLYDGNQASPGQYPGYNLG
ncbi:MAG: spore cortex-lytic protein [Ruminococcaceae bacterium]|nr:spore cortex-lytic protein [Oscillospiraceae bacterium]